ncbi:uncharacterized protein LOC144451851 [Glandiceps talaboti]
MCEIDPIQVVYAPVVTVEPRSITADIGESPSFSCTAQGFPPIRSSTHQWYFNGNTDVPDSTRYIVAQTPDGTLLLTIMSIEESDYDVEIMCKAANSEGTTATQAMLNPVTTPPPPTTKIQTTTGTSGGTVNGTDVDSSNGSKPYFNTLNLTFIFGMYIFFKFVNS